MSGKGM